MRAAWMQQAYETSVTRTAILRLRAWARGLAEGSALVRWLTARPAVPVDLWAGSAVIRAAGRARDALAGAWVRLPGPLRALPGLAGRVTELLLLATALVVALVPFKRQVGPVPVSVEVVLLALLAAVWIVHWALRPEHPRREGPGLRTSVTGLPATVFDPWFAGFLFVLVLSLVNARSLLEGLQTVARQASFFVLFYITVDAARRREGVYRLVDAILAGALLVGCIGLAQYVLGFDLSVSGLAGEEQIRGRIGSTQENPNFLSEYLILLIPVALARTLGTNRIAARVYYGAIVLVLLAAEFLTYTRGGWLGLAVVVAVFVLLVDMRYLLVAAGAGAVAVVAVPGMLERLSGLLDFSTGSGAFRLNLYRAALLMWSRSPWLGVGAGNYLEVYPDIIRDYPLLDLRFHTYSSHNAYLTVAAETGVLGLALFLVIILLALRVAFAGWRHAALREDRLLFLGGGCGMIAFLIQSLSNITFFHPRVVLYYWLLLALLLALYPAAGVDGAAGPGGGARGRDRGR
ncbi:MAG: O-antigen ligase family protein [Symbiobacteriaceae bacterium]